LTDKQSGTILEVSTGSGQHIKYFAGVLPKLEFLPSEYAGLPSPIAKCTQNIEDILGSITSYCKDLPNVLPPIELDAVSSNWTEEDKEGKSPNFAGIICINLLHLSPVDAMVGLIQGASRTLQPGGYLFIYGHFNFRPGPSVPESS
jgi:hypothetical protein